ncbi:MAG: hypothetical protein ACJ788_06505 [Ktedonobacteraceae bacterium]
MKKIWRMVLVLMSLLAALSMAGIANAVVITQASATHEVGNSTFSSKSWRVVPSVNPSPGGDYLRAVAAISSNDAWAAGDYLSGSSKGSMVDQTLIEHFNGSSWSVIPSPNPGTGPNGNYLRAIAAVSANNIYAVGSASGAGALIEHYDGSSWSVVPNPGIGVLQGIVALSANNIWAVGDDGGPTATLIEHFDGSSWSVVPSPNPQGGSGYYNELSAISAVSANNIYAVGYYSGSSPYQTLIEHFDGSKWSIVPSPNVRTANDYLSGVVAISANNIYAVGGSFTLDSVGKTLIEHFNGSKWSIVPSPSPNTLSSLTSIAASSATNIYAVGYSFTGTPSIPDVIEHYNGIKWSVVSSPSPGQQNFLNGVAHVPGTDQFWAVGNDDGNTLVECNC